MLIASVAQAQNLFVGGGGATQTMNTHWEARFAGWNQLGRIKFNDLATLLALALGYQGMGDCRGNPFVAVTSHDCLGFCTLVSRSQVWQLRWIWWTSIR